MRPRPLRPSFVVTVSAACMLSCARNQDFTPHPPGKLTQPTAEPPTERRPPQVASAGPSSTGQPTTADTAPPPESHPPLAVDPKPPLTSVDDRPNMADFPVLRNPRDHERAVFRSWEGAGCFVELDWPADKPRMPGQAPPTQAQKCPPEMSDPAWEACRGGTIHQAQGAAKCICFHMGNPPPLPKRVACPAR